MTRKQTEQSIEPLMRLPIGTDGVGARVDVHAASVCEQITSRKAAYKAAKRGDLRVCGQAVTPHYRLQAGDVLELYEDSRARHPVYDFALKVLYEDDLVAVIEKPAGLPVSGNWVRTVQRALPANLTVSNLPTALSQPRPVHRLDAATGGILLIAKTAAALSALSAQFEARTVRKKYRAIIVGRLQPAHGVLAEPIDGRAAETRYHCLYCSRCPTSGWLTTVDVFPVTGRTHQIRRHLAAPGHPIVGDQQYGGPGPVLKGKGLFLWAVELQFQHPGNGQETRFTLAEPHKFAAHRARQERRWHRMNLAATAGNG